MFSKTIRVLPGRLVLHFFQNEYLLQEFHPHFVFNFFLFDHLGFILYSSDGLSNNLSLIITSLSYGRINKLISYQHNHYRTLYYDMIIIWLYILQAECSIVLDINSLHAGFWLRWVVFDQYNQTAVPGFKPTIIFQK